jgi:MFS family permease
LYISSPRPAEFRHLKHNYIINLLDGGFFGFALGFASFVTMLPLFFSTMTDSAILIGLIPAIHNMGWQLPQLLTAKRVSRLRKFKPFVVFMTIQERLPYLGFALVAWFLPVIGRPVALMISVILLIWQGLGGGMTANAWQNMIGKIIPSDYRGRFFGLQSSVSNLGASLSAVLAGLILQYLNSPADFTLNFLLCSGFMAVSWFFLNQTIEEGDNPAPAEENTPSLGSTILAVVRKDRPFLWFMIGRNVFQFATMAYAFYTVYAVRSYGMSESTAGIMTSILLVSQMAANPLLGWLADRWSKKWVFVLGALSATLSPIVAVLAPSLEWFYLVFILEALANVAFWTIGIALTLEFGTEAERPTYVGMANTLIAPSAVLAPLFGGWLADVAGYSATFLFASAAGLATVIVFAFMMKNPPAKLQTRLSSPRQ